MMANITNYGNASSFVDYEKTIGISHSKVHLKSRIKKEDIDIIVNSSSFGNKYFDYLRDICYKRTLTDKELLKYRYQPKMFCYDNYGSTELWSLLLKMNHMTSITEFNKKTIYVFYSSRIFKLLNEILILERYDITKNTRSTYTD